jgi:hypothetical protein
LGIDAAGDHPGPEGAGCLDVDPTIKDQRHRGGSPDVEMVTDHTLEEGPAGRRAVERPGGGDLKLAERQLVDVTGSWYGTSGIFAPMMQDSPASSIASRLASDTIPASATTVTSRSWWAAMNASMTGSMVLVVG